MDREELQRIYGVDAVVSGYGGVRDEPRRAVAEQYMGPETKAEIADFLRRSRDTAVAIADIQEWNLSRQEQHDRERRRDIERTRGGGMRDEAEAERVRRLLREAVQGSSDAQEGAPDPGRDDYPPGDTSNPAPEPQPADPPPQVRRVRRL